MAYRNDLDALTLRHAALETEVSQRTRELDDARRMLDEAQKRARLPILDNIRVASPCSANWAEMSGDERTRACGLCNKNVYNISTLTRDEAQALIIEHEGKLCVRYFQRADGTIMLKDCAIGAKRKRRRRWIVAGAVISFAGSLIAYTLHESERQSVMGAIALEPGPEEIRTDLEQSAPEDRPTPEPPLPGPRDQWIQGGVAAPIHDLVPSK